MRCLALVGVWGTQKWLGKISGRSDTDWTLQVTSSIVGGTSTCVSKHTYRFGWVLCHKDHECYFCHSWYPLFVQTELEASTCQLQWRSGVSWTGQDHRLGPVIFSSTSVLKCLGPLRLRSALVQRRGSRQAWGRQECGTERERERERLGACRWQPSASPEPRVNWHWGTPDKTRVRSYFSESRGSPAQQSERPQAAARSLVECPLTVLSMTVTRKRLELATAPALDIRMG